MTDEAQATDLAAKGWYLVGGMRLYWTGTAWEAINGRTPNAPPPGTEPGTADAAVTGWARLDAPTAPRPVGRVEAPGNALIVLGVIELLVGVVLFLVPPEVIAQAAGVPDVSVPALYGQYGIAVCLVVTGALFACTWHIVRHIWALRTVSFGS